MSAMTLSFINATCLVWTTQKRLTPHRIWCDTQLTLILSICECSQFHPWMELSTQIRYILNVAYSKEILKPTLVLHLPYQSVIDKSRSIKSPICFIWAIRSSTPRTKKNIKYSLDLMVKYTGAIGMKFGLDNCTVFHVNRESELDDVNNVRLIDESIVKHLDAEGSLTFLGVHETNVQNISYIRQVLRSKYMVWLRQIWKSCFFSKNKISLTDMLAVSLI